MKPTSGGRQWFRHLVYWFFDASQGDAVPNLELMLAPRNFSSFERTSPSRGGRSRSPGRPSSEPGLVKVGREKRLRVREQVEKLSK